MGMPPWAGSGTATTTPAVVDVRQPGTGEIAGSVAIRNTGATNSLLVSFDGGKTFVPTLAAGESFTVSKVALSSIQVKSGAATTTYEWMSVDREDN